jgi:acetyltransferase-like isoleucine patch superfamily enzyme
VDHECILGDGVHVMGAAAIVGRGTIEGFASVGTNATVLPDLTVGSGALFAGLIVFLRQFLRRVCANHSYKTQWRLSA